jgi:hypothetical protein
VIASTASNLHLLVSSSCGDSFFAANAWPRTFAGLLPRAGRQIRGPVHAGRPYRPAAAEPEWPAALRMDLRSPGVLGLEDSRLLWRQKRSGWTRACGLFVRHRSCRAILRSPFSCGLLQGRLFGSGPAHPHASALTPAVRAAFSAVLRRLDWQITLTRKESGSAGILLGTLQTMPRSPDVEQRLLLQRPPGRGLSPTCSYSHEPRLSWPRACFSPVLL